jgi:hypothetical protein
MAEGTGGFARYALVTKLLSKLAVKGQIGAGRVEAVVANRRADSKRNPLLAIRALPGRFFPA